MNRLDLNQINDYQAEGGQGYEPSQMDPSATFYPSKAVELDPEFGDSSQLSDIRGQSFQSSQRPNRLDTSSFASNTMEHDKEMIIKYIDELKYSELRDNALLELSRQREHFQELAPFIWHSVGTIPALLFEIVSVYPLLSPPLLDSKTSNKACNVLAMLQCVASHKDTRYLFLKANIHFYTFPFLNTVSKGRSFEYLRLTSLGVIGALVKVDDPKVIDFLIKTEIIPLCLRIMERGTELSQTVATFIIQKILMDEEGLKYLCMKPERYLAVSNVLNFMVESQLAKPSQRLLKHIIKCYYRLSENSRASVALTKKVPAIVKCNNKLNEALDDSSKKLLQSLIETLTKVEDRHRIQGTGLEDSITIQQHQQLQQQMQTANPSKNQMPQKMNPQQQIFRQSNAAPSGLQPNSLPFQQNPNQRGQAAQPSSGNKQMPQQQWPTKSLQSQQTSPQSTSPGGFQYKKPQAGVVSFQPSNFMMQPPQQPFYNTQPQFQMPNLNPQGRTSPQFQPNFFYQQ